jgi:DnaJ like chaperone protein
MIWQGKAIGGVFGLLFFGPIGALIGVFIGHMVDAQAEKQFKSRSASSAHRIQEVFFRATFRVMGHVAKSDGHVSEDEIRAARAIMSELRLGEREVHFAIELFTEGKANTFPLNLHLRELVTELRGRPDLCRMFVQIQLQVAVWAGSMTPSARLIMDRVCDALGVSAYEMAQMEALLRMQRGGDAGYQQRTHSQPRADRLAEAYQVLGVSESATDAEVTKAYRRLMNQNHPDKLLAKGLPEAMMKVAQQKTIQIRAAYDAVREARGMK